MVVDAAAVVAADTRDWHQYVDHIVGCYCGPADVHVADLRP